MKLMAENSAKRSYRALPWERGGRRTTAADVWPGSFRAWLNKQASARRTDAVGDLARDLAIDPCLGQGRTPQAIVRHMQAMHYPCDAALAAFEVAIAEWQDAA